jgi:4-hydroxybenzoyl-CoA reductase alpha subunit
MPRIESLGKALGELRFLSDLKFPGLLHGKILRSPHPHAKIKRIDTSRAVKLRGVKAVITVEDTPKIKWCWLPRYADKYILAYRKVRYVGDEVAAVAAVDEETAEEALDLIHVEYEQLPAVLTPEEALMPEAPILHQGESNIALQVERKFGDVEKGFAKADVIVEDRFETSSVAHCCLEPRGCVADFSRTGKLTLWSTTQSPHALREEMGQILGMDAKKIRVIKAAMGGAFGSRIAMDMKEPIAALLSRKTRRPVRIVNTREEEFTASRIRYPFNIHLKTGAKKDGTLMAREAKVIMNNGAYNDKGLAVLTCAGYYFPILYRVPHVRYEGIAVYTNTVYGGAFRGFGNPQMTFAIESQMDRLAERLGIDPVELRIKNSNQPGDTTISGAKITSCALKECIETAASAIGLVRDRRRIPNRGIGIAAAFHSGAGHRMYNFNSAHAFISISESGKVNVFTGASDLGQGAETVLAQIAAEELGMRFEDITIIAADTETTPVDLGAVGSRTTFTSGNAVKSAATAVKKQLLEEASEQLEANKDDLEAREGNIFVRGTPGIKLPIAEMIRSCYGKGHPVTGMGRFEDPYPPDLDPVVTGYGSFFPTFSFASQGVEVEVNPETGVVRVLKMVAAIDVGRALNPMDCEGQVQGALAQGMGFGLLEGLVWDRQGTVANPSFADYRLVRSADIPKVEVKLIESIDPNGPFGAKGIGELGIDPTAAAISNAIYDAVGVRIRSLPITAEKIRKALEQKSVFGNPEREKKEVL